jgi:3-deoxy-D-arabino-heptulosonate 7-phosphate (DAHP) synthase
MGLRQSIPTASRFLHRSRNDQDNVDRLLRVAVLLKRGLSSTVKELLMSAEYITAHGNPDVILRERGIRTFGTVTRNTCDIAAIPARRATRRYPAAALPSVTASS